MGLFDFLPKRRNGSKSSLSPVKQNPATDSNPVLPANKEDINFSNVVYPFAPQSNQSQTIQNTTDLDLNRNSFINNSGVQQTPSLSNELSKNELPNPIQLDSLKNNQNLPTELNEGFSTKSQTNPDTPQQGYDTGMGSQDEVKDLVDDSTFSYDLSNSIINNPTTVKDNIVPQVNEYTNQEGIYTKIAPLSLEKDKGLDSILDQLPDSSLNPSNNDNKVEQVTSSHPTINPFNSALEATQPSVSSEDLITDNSVISNVEPQQTQSTPELVAPIDFTSQSNLPAVESKQIEPAPDNSNDQLININPLQNLEEVNTPTNNEVRSDDIEVIPSTYDIKDNSNEISEEKKSVTGDEDIIEANSNNTLDNEIVESPQSDQVNNSFNEIDLSKHLDLIDLGDEVNEDETKEEKIEEEKVEEKEEILKPEDISIPNILGDYTQIELTNFKTVGFVGLNTEEINENIATNISSIVEAFSQVLNEIIIDSNKGYGKEIINTLINLKYSKLKLTGIFLRPSYSGYSDDSGTNINYEKYTSILYSNYLERFKHIVNVVDFFIIPEVSGLINFSTVFTLLSIQHLYVGQAKPVILIGANWKNIIQDFKDKLLFTSEEIQSIHIVSDSDEAISLIQKIDQEFSTKSPIPQRKVIDMRSDNDEDGFFYKRL